MRKIYHIYAYKHFWVADDPITMPYTSDSKDYVIEASSKSEAIKLA